MNERTNGGPEPIAHLTWPADAEPVTVTGNLEDRLAIARNEYILSRLILPILNSSDAELERKIRAFPDETDSLDLWIAFCEDCYSALERNEAGVEALGSAAARLTVLLERVGGYGRIYGEESPYDGKLGERPA